MMKILSSIPAIFLVFCSLLKIQAQNVYTCEEKLMNAEKLYKQGLFRECMENISPCINTLKGSDRSDGYRILALANQGLNNSELSKKYAKDLLRSKPDYLDFPYFDPVEFTKLLENYDVWNGLEVGIQTGINFNMINLVKAYSATASDGIFYGDVGYNAGILLQYNIRKRIGIVTGAQIEGLNYHFTSKEVQGWNQNVNERLTYLTIPLTAQLDFWQKNKLHFFLDIGFQTQILLNSIMRIELTNNQNGEQFQNSKNLDNQRTPILIYGLAGLGTRYFLTHASLFASVKLAYGLNLFNSTGNRNENLEYLIQNRYMDSDIKFNPLYFVIGYQIPIQGTTRVIEKRRSGK